MVLKTVYHLPYRQLIGFVFSIFSLINVVLKVPHFTTVTSRAKLLVKHLKRLYKSSPTDLVFDRFSVRGNGKSDSTASKKEGDGKSFILAYVQERMKSLLQKYRNWKQRIVK